MKYSIKVNEVRAKEGSNIKGFATVVFGDSFKITNIAILENKDKGELFVSMPRYRSNERDESNGVIYKDVCNPMHNAGAIFLGQYAPEPLGDYMAGPCHVLPTSGTARFFSPLSTDTFLKKTSVIEYTRDALESYAQDIIALAQSEHLDAHANSIAVRFAEENDNENR